MTLHTICFHLFASLNVLLIRTIVHVSRNVNYCRAKGSRETPKISESLFERWRNNLITLGVQVLVSSGDDVFEGIAEAVAEDGGLLLRQSGTLTKFLLGDMNLRQ